MSQQRERLEHLLERIERLRRQTPHDKSTSLPRAARAGSCNSEPALPGAALAGPEWCTRLELLALRDQTIQAELYRLQRTLSRQSFRGAESARRLVRRLVRRAEQNIADVRTLQSQNLV